MTDTTPQITTSYLAQLDTELEYLPRDIRRDIVSGIREELQGLDAAAATARIQQLGDPSFIAAEARAETARNAPPMATDSQVPGRGFSITAVVVLIAGSLLVPFIGALVGLLCVSRAKAWSRREKVAAWLAPLGVALLALAIVALLSSATMAGSHAVLLASYLVFPLEGIALAIRGRRRGWLS